MTNRIPPVHKHEREHAARQAPAPLNRVMHREMVHDRRLTKQTLRQAINKKPSTIN
jgi:hypothetical protein